MFQGGVVPFYKKFLADISFRPLMFQGGVVLNGLGQKPGKGFRPLLFQGGVVLGTIITPVNGEF